MQLAGELPPTVVADLLGLRPKTAVAWSHLNGRPWGDYHALRGSAAPWPGSQPKDAGEAMSGSRLLGRGAS
jgi:hypothetical protein